MRAPARQKPPPNPLQRLSSLSFICCRYADCKLFRTQLAPAPHPCSGGLLSAACPPHYNQLPRSAKRSRGRGTGGHNHAISFSSNKCNLNGRAGGSIPKMVKLNGSTCPFSPDPRRYSSTSIFPLSVPAHTPVLRGSKIHCAFLRQRPC